MLAGYALLLGEKHKTHINQGLVEYPAMALVRAAQIHSVDCARVLRIRDRIRQIKEGRLPDRPRMHPARQRRFARRGIVWRRNSFKHILLCFEMSKEKIRTRMARKAIYSFSPISRSSTSGLK
jgi:hypothetical protein